MKRAIVAAYAAVVLAHVLPPLPVIRDTKPVADLLVRPLLVQHWQLFAPAPPRQNLDLWLQTRGPLGDGEHVNLSDAARRLATGRRLMPTRVVRVTANLAMALSRGEGRGAGRFLSAAALGTSAAPVQEVRGIVVSRPFHGEPAVVADTGWLPVEPGVAPLRLR